MVCRRRCPQSELVRIRWDSLSERLSVDRVGSGRSAYVCDSAVCRKQVTVKGQLERALRRSLPFGAGLPFENEREECQR